jgi:DNA polymerase-3 subunit epsilon
MREVVLDTETTGLNYRSGDRVVEVGCVELINHIATGKTLQFYCSVDKKIDEGAIKIHGLTNEFLSKHPSFEAQAEKFLNFIRKDILIIHNAEFDVGFLNNELKIIGRGELKNEIIDTVMMARKTLNTRIANLDSLCRRFSIDLSKRELHGALLDTHLLAEVYLELNGGKQISMNLSEIDTKKRNLIKIGDKTTLNLSKVISSQDELLEHKNMLKQIKNPLWKRIDY